MRHLLFVNLMFLAAGGLLLLLDAGIRRQFRLTEFGPLKVLVTGFAVVNILLVVFLWINHFSFPLNLEIMEGTILQHVQRVISMEAVYPAPTPEYVPLSYNPLYYVLAVPFTWVLGISISTLRLLTILGTIGCAVILYRVIEKKACSKWWGLIAVGLFAGSYQAMDHFFDAAHSDMWMLFSVMVGCCIIDRKLSRAWNIVAVVVLVAAFWFKQHGAWFAVGGVVYLTWREGLKRSIPYWLVAFFLGPVLYFAGGPAIFGSHFHYFTWEMPRGWMEFNVESVRVVGRWVLRNSPFLSLSALGWAAWVAFKRREDVDVWTFQFVPALMCGALGALDPGSSYNNFIPMGTWFILLGITCLAALDKNGVRAGARGVALVVLVVSFAVLVYNPASVVVPRESRERYGELIAMLTRLPGPVYGPSIGQFQRDFSLFPTANWVALEDMVRGPGRELRNQPVARRLLDPVIHPLGEAFILAYHPLDYYPWIAFLDDYYVLEEDFGGYYSSLGVLRVRYDHGFPRYVYRFSPKGTSSQDPN